MCIFCNIVDGKIPNQTVAQNEDFLAFNDISPLAKIHILIIPKKHISSFNEVSPQTMANMTTFIQEIVEKLDIKDNGYRLITNIGKQGGQEVEHLHFHLLAGEQLGKII
ncbi:MAG: histidine triad nucleotide-binding protein [Campylobacterota bacterium]|nr:histidine triad nucleotide-binding protein [Campylobacterota bacterium]